MKTLWEQLEDIQTRLALAEKRGNRLAMLKLIKRRNDLKREIGGILSKMNSGAA